VRQDDNSSKVSSAEAWQYRSKLTDYSRGAGPRIRRTSFPLAMKLAVKNEADWKVFRDDDGAERRGADADQRPLAEERSEGSEARSRGK